MVGGAAADGAVAGGVAASETAAGGAAGSAGAVTWNGTCRSGSIAGRSGGSTPLSLYRSTKQELWESAGQVTLRKGMAG